VSRLSFISAISSSSFEFFLWYLHTLVGCSGPTAGLVAVRVIGNRRHAQRPDRAHSSVATTADYCFARGTCEKCDALLEHFVHFLDLLFLLLDFGIARLELLLELLDLVVQHELELLELLVLLLEIVNLALLLGNHRVSVGDLLPLLRNLLLQPVDLLLELLPLLLHDVHVLGPLQDLFLQPASS